MTPQLLIFLALHYTNCFSSTGNYVYLLQHTLLTNWYVSVDLCLTFILKMLQVSHLEQIHSHGYVHGDIKPQNILIGLGDQCRTPFIVDFGPAQKYHCTTTGIHIPFRQVQRIRGTPAFSSIHSHLGAEIGQRNDLESLAYTLIYLVHGSLPWHKDKRQQASSILEMKQKIPVEVLCHQAPCELATFLTYTHTLSFLENPNYSYIQFLFGTLRRGTSNLEHGPLFDLSLPASSPLESECR